MLNFFFTLLFHMQGPIAHFSSSFKGKPMKEKQWIFDNQTHKQLISSLLRRSWDETFCFCSFFPFLFTASSQLLKKEDKPRNVFDVCASPWTVNPPHSLAFFYLLSNFFFLFFCLRSRKECGALSFFRFASKHVA